MNQYTVMNILDLMDSVGENEVQKGLSDFSCPLNEEIENFIRNNAIAFSKRNKWEIKRNLPESAPELDSGKFL